MVQVTDYLSVVHYLGDLYQERKKADAQFSYQAWASELGIRNRSFLRLIVMGHRPITLSSQKILIRGLNLSGVQKEYFENLVSYSQEKDAVKRQSKLAKLMEILRLVHDQREIPDSIEFLSSPRIPALQVLLSFEDIPRKSEELAALMGVPEEQINHWLRSLEKLGLCHFDDERREWLATQKNFKIQEKLGSQPLQHYHREVLKETAEALAYPVESRRFRTLLMALSAEDYRDFSDKLNNFATQLLSEYSHSHLRGRRLYRFVGCLTPLSSGEHGTTAT